LSEFDPNPLTRSLDGFIKDLNINTVTPYAAAQEAAKRFAQLPSDVQKTFIFTGNKANTVVTPAVMTFGIRKSASWYMIQSLVAAFKDSGFRFYYVDERTPEGKGMRYISGAAHAEMFEDLVDKKVQAPPLATFVRGKGYTAFPREEMVNLPVLTMGDLVDLKYGAP
jgi:hypothetical protein